MCNIRWRTYAVCLGTQSWLNLIGLSDRHYLFERSEYKHSLFETFKVESSSIFDGNFGWQHIRWAVFKGLNHIMRFSEWIFLLDRSLTWLSQNTLRKFQSEIHVPLDWTGFMRIEPSGYRIHTYALERPGSSRFMSVCRLVALCK